MAIEDNTIDKWGGSYRRYQGFPRKRIGLVDPITSLPVAFGTSLIHDNWHRARFDPDVVELYCSPKPLRVCLGWRAFEAVAHLDLRRKSGERELHLVCRRTPPSEKFRALRAVGKLLDAEVIVRTEAAIDPGAIYICNLRELRQRMQLWSGRGSELDLPLKALVAARQSTEVGCLAAEFPDITPQLIDARLGHLHCRGDIQLHLSKEPYGTRTPVSSAK